MLGVLSHMLCITCLHGTFCWASNILLPFRSVLELDDNEADIRLCLVQFSSMPEDELLLAVGTVQGLTFYPRQVDGTELFLLAPSPLSQLQPCIIIGDNFPFLLHYAG